MIETNQGSVDRPTDGHVADTHVEHDAVLNHASHLYDFILGQVAPAKDLYFVPPPSLYPSTTRQFSRSGLYDFSKDIGNTSIM